MFVGIHAVLAERTNTPELMISPDEGKQFMASAQNVMRHYSVQSTQKTMDWIAFGGYASMMYGTRFAAISMRKREEKKPQQQPPSNVVQMTGMSYEPEFHDG